MRDSRPMDHDQTEPMPIPSRVQGTPRDAVRAPVRQRPRRRRFPWRLLLVGLVVGVVVVIFLGWQRAATFNARVSSAPALSASLFGPFAGENRVNVLVLGYGGPGHDGPYLTDSINIVSIDRETETTTVIPIPRDLWVEGVAQLAGGGKINEAFAAGVSGGGLHEGGDEAAATVSAVTGLPIHGWIALDFEGFRAMVDAVGGVTVDNPRAFSYGSPDAAQTGVWDDHYPAGAIELDGTEALYYARTRFTDVTEESSDFARSVRQQRVLSAVVGEVRGGGLGSIGNGLGLMDAVDDHLTTNLSVIDMALLSGRMHADRRIELSEGVILEAAQNAAGQYVLLVVGRNGPTDYSPLQRYLRDRLAEPIEEGSDEPAS